MNNKYKNIIIVVSFFLILGGFFILNIITPSKEVSISERRNLAQLPGLDKLKNGTYLKEFDNYLMDQFIFRDNFRKLKINLDLKTKGNYNNIGLYNNYIYEVLYPLDKASVENLVKRINNTIEGYLSKDNKVYYTVVPDKSYYIDKNNLKINYEEMINFMDKIAGEYISIMDMLSLEDYYLTDTHWREENILKIAKYLGSRMDTSIDDVNFREVTSFRGVYASRLVSSREDKILVGHNDYIDKAYVRDMISNEVMGVYNIDKINSLDKYDIYLGGSKALIEIDNLMSSNDKELIVFRDSYASSLIPLMISGYKKIILVDTRYISPKVLKDYIEFTNQDVLFIYGGILVNNSYTVR